MTTKSLPQIFLLAFSLSAVITCMMVPFNFAWASSFAYFALAFNINWIGLALLLIGHFQKDFFMLFFGAHLKFAAYVAIFLYCVQIPMEPISFLLALHLFHVSAFAFAIRELIISSLKNHSEFPYEGVVTHG